MEIPLRTVFNAISLTMLLIEHGRGVNAWRQQTKKGLLPPDHILRDEGTAPPSKPEGVHTGEKGNIWHSLHMVILIPALHRLKDHSDNDKLKGRFLTPEKTREYIGHFDVLKAHIQQHHEHRETIIELQNYDFPDDPDDLPPNLKAFLDGERNNGGNVENNANHLIGRIIQAYYAHKTGDYPGFGLPPEAKAYFESKGGLDLFQRTLIYARDWVSKCPLDKDSTSLADALKFYSWLANPAVVEMITPKFTGAASAAGEKLSNLVDFIHEETDIDLRQIVLTPTAAQQLRKNPTLLERIKAMEEFFRRYHNYPEIGRVDLTPIIEIRQKLWLESVLR